MAIFTALDHSPVTIRILFQRKRVTTLVHRRELLLRSNFHRVAKLASDPPHRVCGRCG
jgi:hypothetical protein